VSGVYETTVSIKSVLDDILNKTRSNFEKLYPDAVQLTW